MSFYCTSYFCRNLCKINNDQDNALASHFKLLLKPAVGFYSYAQVKTLKVGIHSSCSHMPYPILRPTYILSTSHHMTTFQTYRTTLKTPLFTSPYMTVRLLCAHHVSTLDQDSLFTTQQQIKAHITVPFEFSQMTSNNQNKTQSCVHLTVPLPTFYLLPSLFQLFATQVQVQFHLWIFPLSYFLKFSHLSVSNDWILLSSKSSTQCPIFRKISLPILFKTQLYQLFPIPDLCFVPSLSPITLPVHLVDHCPSPLLYLI